MDVRHPLPRPAEAAKALKSAEGVPHPLLCPAEAAQASKSVVGPEDSFLPRRHGWRPCSPQCRSIPWRPSPNQAGVSHPLPCPAEAAEASNAARGYQAPQVSLVYSHMELMALALCCPIALSGRTFSLGHILVVYIPGGAIAVAHGDREAVDADDCGGVRRRATTPPA